MGHQETYCSPRTTTTINKIGLCLEIMVLLNEAFTENMTKGSWKIRKAGIILYDFLIIIPIQSYTVTTS